MTVYINGVAVAGAIAAHDTTHEDTGGDEVSVAGLSGLLADDQHVLDAEVTAVAIARSIADVNSMLYAVSDNTPAALAVAASRIVGRKSTGNIVALSAAELLTIINVAAGADVTGSNAPQAHKTTHQDGGGDEVGIGGLSGLLADDQHVLDAEVIAVAIAKSLMTTRGDIIVRNATVPARLAKGTEGQMLVMGVNDPSWGGVPDFQRFTSSNTWTKPAGVTHVYMEVIGAGGGGAGGTGANTGGGGGGGGSNRTQKMVPASSCGATESVTVGAGGTGGADTVDGGNGGDSSFGSFMTAYGGGGGQYSARRGGGGGGSAEAGIGGGSSVPGLPRYTDTTTLGDALSGGGAAGGPSAGGKGSCSEYGGAGGGSGGASSSNGQDGGSSLYGGAGGGGGSKVVYDSGEGGTTPSYTPGGGGAANGSNGADGLNEYCGEGGGGGDGPQNGGNGGAPGGGGGGSGASSGGYTGGVGGRGEVRVWSW